MGEVGRESASDLEWDLIQRAASRATQEFCFSVPRPVLRLAHMIGRGGPAQFMRWLRHELCQAGAGFQLWILTRKSRTATKLHKFRKLPK